MLPLLLLFTVRNAGKCIEFGLVLRSVGDDGTDTANNDYMS